MKPCLGCGELTEQSRCPSCRLPDRRKRQRPSATQRGYNYRWQQASRKARRLQPFCTDCNRPDTEVDLELDHKGRAAWERVAKGLPIRLGVDAEVVCHVCNVKRGAARGHNVNHTG